MQTKRATKQEDLNQAMPVLANVSLSQQLEQVELLTNDLKRLLVRYEASLEREGVRHQLEILERWMESYRRGLSAAQKLTENAHTWLGDIRECMRYSAEELQRLEDEGGNAASPQQMHHMENLVKALRRMDTIIPSLEQTFCLTENSESKHFDPDLSDRKEKHHA